MRTIVYFIAIINGGITTETTKDTERGKKVGK
jgi:hypothetical protein